MRRGLWGKGCVEGAVGKGLWKDVLEEVEGVLVLLEGLLVLALGELVVALVLEHLRRRQPLRQVATRLPLPHRLHVRLGLLRWLRLRGKVLALAQVARLELLLDGVPLLGGELLRAPST